MSLPRISYPSGGERTIVTDRTLNPKDVVYIGIGEDVDRMPEVQKTTKYWVTAASCAACGCSGRLLVPEGDRLILRCVDCGSIGDAGLEARHLPEITFVYWCRFARFPSDQVELSQDQRAEIERLIRELGPEPETPYYAMIITSGLCLHAFHCLAQGCPYRASPLMLDRLC